MVKSPSGYPIQSPYVAIANRQAEIMMRIASEFAYARQPDPNLEPSVPGRTLFDFPEEPPGNAAE